MQDEAVRTWVCRKCKQQLAEDDFARNKRALGGRMWMCRQCDGGRRNRAGTSKFGIPYGVTGNDWHYRRTYGGFTEAQYFAMLESQGGGCKVCGARPKTIRLSVDHDEVDGKVRVRGIVCKSCNVSLEKIDKLAAYLGFELVKVVQR